MVILINFHDFNATERTRTSAPRLSQSRALPTELTDAPSLQEEYQPQNTYSEIIVYERVSDSDRLFGSFLWSS